MAPQPAPATSLTFIKLGGSVITDKTKPQTLRGQVMARLVGEIAAAHRQTGQRYLIGHGAGSYGHVSAAKYGTKQGLTDQNSVLGMATVQDEVAQLNRAVVGEFLARRLPAVTLAVSNMLVTRAGRAAQAADINLAVLEQYLAWGLWPITHGDVIADRAQGSTIWSTEQILDLLARRLPRLGYPVERVIHVTDVAGVVIDGRVVPEITPEQWPRLSRSAQLKAPRGTDVTGGIRHKVEAALELAGLGIESVILSGLKSGTLKRCLLGQEVTKTVIAANLV